MKWFLLLIVLVFSAHLHAQNNKNDSSCNSVFIKAADKYGVIFNYSSQVLETITCPTELPDDFSDFRKLVKEYSGLDVDRFSNDLWVIKKNFTHEIKIINQDNQPVLNAYLKSKQKISNIYGKIFLNIDKTGNQLLITHPNYKDYPFTVAKNSPKQIILALKRKPISLSPVNLKTLYTNSVFLNDKNHIQVKIKETPILAGQTQQDAFVSLLNLPQISSTVESIAELNIKGGINDQNLVLWNGIRMFQNSHFFGLISAFNENLIDEMTVIDNATPVEYGNALTGTVKLDFDKDFSAKDTYGVGIYALSGQAFTKLALNKNTELSLAFQRSFTDFFNSATYQSYAEKAFRDTDLDLLENPDVTNNSIQRDDDFYFRDAQFQLKKRFNENFRVNLQGIWFENKLTYQENITQQSIESQDTIHTQDTRVSNYDNTNVALGVDAAYKLSNQQAIILKSNFSKHTSIGENNTFTGNLNTDQSNTVENYFTQVSWNRYSNNHSLQLGADFQGSVVLNRFDNFITEAFLNSAQVSNIYSGFSSYQYNKNRWNLYTGLKGVYYQRDNEWSLEPRFSASYKLNKNFDVVVKSEVKSQNFKQIIDLDQNFLGIEKRRWVVSGDSISPPLQKTFQAEIMLKWHFNKFGGYTSLYSRDLNGISTNDQRFQNEGQFQELQEGEANIYGALVHFYYKNKWLNTWLSYAHLSEKVIFDNQQFRGNNEIDHQLKWGNNIKYKQWNFSLALTYYSGLPFTDVVEAQPVIASANNNNSINFKEPNSSKLPIYFRLDSSLQYLVKTDDLGNFTLSAGLINLTNNKNILRRNFRLNRVDENEIQKIENIGLNFTVNLGIRWIL